MDTFHAGEVREGANRGSHMPSKLRGQTRGCTRRDITPGDQLPQDRILSISAGPWHISDPYAGTNGPEIRPSPDNYAEMKAKVFGAARQFSHPRGGSCSPMSDPKCGHKQRVGHVKPPSGRQMAARPGWQGPSLLTCRRLPAPSAASSDERGLRYHRLFRLVLLVEHELSMSGHYTG